MYAIDFEYAGELLSDYGMVIGNFDGSSDGTVQSGADIKFNQIKPSLSDKSLIVSSSYEESYSTTFQILRNPCLIEDFNDMYLDTTEVSQLQRWLCQKQYKKFKVPQDGYYDLYWNAVFSSQQIMFCGKIIGLEITMYTDHPYAFNDELEIEYDCSDNNEFTVYNLSDETGVLYPRIEIEILEDTDSFLIYNQSEIYRKTEVKNCSNGEVITFSGDSKVIKTSFETVHKKLAQDFNFIYPRIMNTYEDRENIFHVNTPCRIKMYYSPIKKVGL